MGRDTLTTKPFSYELYLESLEPDVDWKEWAKKVKKFQRKHK